VAGGALSVLQARYLTAALCVLAALTACDNSSPVEPPATSLAPVEPCALQPGCRADAAGLSIRVQSGAPPRALTAFPVSAHTSGTAVVEAVTVTFIMEGMAMGLNRYRMLGDGAGGWRAEVVLPICVSGRGDWTAEFELSGAGRRAVLKVPFVLEKPLD
jgi:hypothetical protein